MKKPWEIQPGEDPERFRAFDVYRGLGVSRNCDVVAKETKKAKATIYKWSSEGGWAERAKAWDRHAAEVEQADAIEQEMEARKRSRRARIAAAERILGITLRRLSEAADHLANHSSFKDLSSIVSQQSANLRAEYGEGDKLDVTVRGVPSGTPWDRREEILTQHLERIAKIHAERSSAGKDKGEEW